METQQAMIYQVRASVLQQLGRKVIFQLDKGRRRIEQQEGILQDAYPSVFTILVNDDNPQNASRILSFSYVDVLTKDIRMKLCET